ncbi:hypothetical protein SEA_GATOR_48 [Mycobacterium phage Gator]|nr:hypothetical protein SEA_GATOR_48 [Mycobacterium phage Gator]
MRASASESAPRPDGPRPTLASHSASAALIEQSPRFRNSP